MIITQFTGMFGDKVYKGRFAKIQCRTEDPLKVVIKSFCFIKNYNRDVSTSSFGLITSIEANKIHVSLTCYLI